MINHASSVISLDVGSKRIGVALASLAARLPRPYKTLEQGPNLWVDLQNIVASEAVNTIVVGLPRGLDGQPTQQTKSVEAFVTQLRQHGNVPVVFQDEAVTSKQAEAELEVRGKPYVRADIDALAATYILEDWLAANSRELAV